MKKKYSNMTPGEFFYRLKLNGKKVPCESNQELFQAFIAKAKEAYGKLEGKLKTQDLGYTLGVGREILREYYFNEPFDKVVYKEKTQYDNNPSESEINNDFKSNLRYFSKPLAVFFDDKSNFLIE